MLWEIDFIRQVKLVKCCRQGLGSLYCSSSWHSDVLHSKKPKVKAVSVDILEYQVIPGTMACLAEMAATDSEVTKVIEVSLQEKLYLFLHVLGATFTVYNNVIIHQSLLER